MGYRSWCVLASALVLSACAASGTDGGSQAADARGAAPIDSGPGGDHCGDDVGSACADGGPGGGGSSDAGGGSSDAAPGGMIVEVDLFFVGDCVTATCPAEAPYPVGCNVVFSPGDDRGCVASQPTSSTAYFQAGDECNAGIVAGSLFCSDTVGAPLDYANCPINKPVPLHVGAPDQCPEITD